MIKVVYVDDGVSIVGVNAFADRYLNNLETAYVSSSVKSIGRNAFTGVQKDIYVYSDNALLGELWVYNRVTIHAHEGSTAETYAKLHDINFAKICVTHENLETTEVVQETCETDGFSGIVTCKDCGMIVDQGHVIPALTHDYKTINAVEASCENEGYTGDIVCSRCGDVQSKGHIDNAKGHNWGSWNIISMPTCTEAGENIRFCERCGDQETKPTSAIGHSFGTEYTTETKATCVNEGTEYRLCTRCKTEKDYRTIPMTDHTWASEATIDVNATCTSDGEQSIHCEYCSERKDVASVPATGHEYKTITKAAQIGIAGKIYDECENCGDVINEKAIAAKVPATTSITSLKAVKKGFTVKWSKKAYTGYQIRYSAKSSMASSKTVTVAKNSTVSKKITKLKAKKKYYVQVRTYKTVNGKKYYSAWSTKKSVKTK